MSPQKTGFLRELCIRVVFALFQMCVHTVFGEGLVVLAGRQKPDGLWCSLRTVLLTYLYEEGVQKVS